MGGDSGREARLRVLRSWVLYFVGDREPLRVFQDMEALVLPCQGNSGSSMWGTGRSVPQPKQEVMVSLTRRQPKRRIG